MEDCTVLGGGGGGGVHEPIQKGGVQGKGVM